MRAVSGLCTLLFSQVVQAEWDSHGYSSSSPIFTTALFIGALHAFPMVFVAYKAKSKPLTVLTAIVMAIVAVVAGGSAYAFGDLFFVGLGTYIAFKLYLESDELPARAVEHPKVHARMGFAESANQEPLLNTCAEEPERDNTASHRFTVPVSADHPDRDRAVGNTKHRRPAGKPNNIAEAIVIGLSNAKSHYAAERQRQAKRSDAKLREASRLAIIGIRKGAGDLSTEVTDEEI